MSGPSNAYAAHPTRVTVAACLFAASSVAAAVAAVGLSRLLQRRRSVLGQAGVAGLFIGSFGAMGWASGQLVLARAPHPPDRQAMIAFYDRALEALALLVPLQLGAVVGALLLAVALRRAGVIPTWLMIWEFATVTAIVVVQSSDLSITTAGPLTTWILGLVFYGFVGIQMLQQPNESREDRTLLTGSSRPRSPAPADQGP
jgi:hypothetical protein